MTLHRVAAAMTLSLALSACEGSEMGFPFDFERMIDQPRLDAYSESSLFEDGMAMRVPPAHTVPYRPEGAMDRSRASGGPVSRRMLEEGRDRFDAFCAACHGLDGYADTPVAHSMTLRRPPSLHEPRLRALSAEDLRRVIREGYGLMPSYASLLEAPRARAVAEYVKVLQASQHQLLDVLPAALQREANAALAKEDSP